MIKNGDPPNLQLPYPQIEVLSILSLSQTTGTHQNPQSSTYLARNHDCCTVSNARIYSNPTLFSPYSTSSKYFNTRLSVEPLSLDVGNFAGLGEPMGMLTHLLPLASLGIGIILAKQILMLLPLLLYWLFYFSF